MHWPIIGRPIIGDYRSAANRCQTIGRLPINTKSSRNRTKAHSSHCIIQHWWRTCAGWREGCMGRGYAAWSITDQSPPMPCTPPHASDATPLTSRPMVTAWHDSIRLVFTPNTTAGNWLSKDYMTGQVTVNIAIKQLGGCIVLAYSVKVWGILCMRHEDSGVAVQATAMRRHL